MGGPCLTDEEQRLAREAYGRRLRIADACRASGRSTQVVTDYLVKVGLHVRREQWKGRKGVSSRRPGGKE